MVFYCYFRKLIFQIAKHIDSLYRNANDGVQSTQYRRCYIEHLICFRKHKNKDYIYFDYYSKSILKARDMWFRCIYYILKVLNFIILLQLNTIGTIYTLSPNHKHHHRRSFVAWRTAATHIPRALAARFHANIFMSRNCIIH